MVMTQTRLFEKVEFVSTSLNYSNLQSLIPNLLIMTKATWNGVTLAESDATVVVENNQYFPADSLNKEYFKDSNTHSSCGWKGLCSYYSIEVDGQTNPDAAWYYPEPKDAAKNIAGYVAFWKGVKVV
jgi:uncharacterized protein (DUF427 family)